MLYDYPVFRKDFRRLLRFMVAALLLQGVLLVLAKSGPLSRAIPLTRDAWFWFPRLQVVVSMLIALVASAHLLAEERENGTDRFLSGLAVSRKRMFQEKIAAGLSIVLLTLLVQFAWGLLIGLAAGVDLWFPRDITQIVVTMTTTSVLAYVIGLPLSMYFRRSIYVILTGMIPSLAVTWMIQVPWSRQAPETAYFLFTLVALGIPIAAPVLGGTFVGRRFPRISGRHGPTLALLAKQTREKAVIYLVLAPVIVFAFLAKEAFFILAGLAFLLFAVVFGVATYTREEKTAGSSVLYHHPASRSRVFWTKFLHGLLPLLIPLLMLAALGIALREWGLIPHSGEYYVAQVGSFVLWVVIAYCCGALFTHACASPIYGTLGGIVGLILAAVLFVYIRILPGTRALEIIQFGAQYVPSTGLFPAGDFPSLSVFLLPLFLVAAGLALSAWRASTDRMLQSGSSFFRFTSVLRLFLFTFAVVIVLTRVGWRDLFYLITHIDLGTG
jgi:ABC-type transport system involved in multi-copper enzyme maturation permease subunit